MGFTNPGPFQRGPNEVTFNAAISSCEGQWQQALHLAGNLWGEGEVRGGKPNKKYHDFGGEC